MLEWYDLFGKRLRPGHSFSVKVAASLRPGLPRATSLGGFGQLGT
jgi:hypothetical protein